jgi:glycosyltransferase involved in cell wall biosynthesis
MRLEFADKPMRPLTNSESLEAMQKSPAPGRELRSENQRVLIIIPAYNEAGSLPELLRSMRAECPACDVVVIDDGSTDATRRCVAEIARVISLPCNLGIGGAVQTGLQVAFREDYDFALQVDGDGQHPPREVHKLLDAIRESNYDMVVGSRFRVAGGFKSTATRRMGIRFFSILLSAICGTKITDPTSGFRVVNRRGIRLLAHNYSEDFPEVEALVVARRAGLRIAEIPVEMSERTAGTSSIGSFKSLIYMIKVPLAIFMTLIRKPEVESK